jgi:uncharacterized repeat protein (TIGR01451 family)
VAFAATSVLVCSLGALGARAAPALPGTADVSIAGTATPDPATTGSILTYALTVSNGGPEAADGVTVTDTLPPTVAFGSATPDQGSCKQVAAIVTCALGGLAAGADGHVTITVTPTSAGTAVDTATVSATTVDADATNNTVTLSTTITGSSISTADLGVTGTASPDPAAIGKPLTYTLTVANGGPDAATSVSLADTLPSNATYTSATSSQGSCSQATGIVTCSLGDIAPAGQAVTTIAVAPTAAGALEDAAAVSSTTVDPNPQNNSLALSTLVNGTGTAGRLQPDLLVRRKVRGSRFRGDGVYNRTGRHQRLLFGLRRGRTAQVIIEIQNDGDALDDIVLAGPGHRKGFAVEYFLRKTNITRRVTGRGFVLTGLQPGGLRRVRMVLTARRRAHVGVVRRWLVTGRSRGDPLKLDAVRLAVKIVRG